MWRWRVRARGRGRPMKPRYISYLPPTPTILAYGPIPPPPPTSNPIIMTPDEFEAFILIYRDGLTQEEAARRMGVSRGTLWRSLESARRKIAEMLATRRPLVIR